MLSKLALSRIKIISVEGISEIQF